VLIDVDASDAAAACHSQVHRRTTGAAADLEHVILRPHLHRVRKSKPVRSGHPAALPDVVTESLMAYGRLGAAGEISIDVVMEIDGCGHMSSCRTSTHCIKCEPLAV
jgi:hypothetical protein